DADNHRSHLGQRGLLPQPLLARQHPGLQTRRAQALLQMPSGRVLGHHREARPVLQAQRFQLRQPGVTRQGEHLITLRMARHHIQRAETDGAGGAQHGDPLRAHRLPQPAAQSSTANTGMAAVRLSMRSSTPPWPGSRLLLSFTPAWRLNMLSARSPTTEISTTTAAPARAASSSEAAQSRYKPTPRVISRLASRPPTRPSQLLPGLTFGASLRLPNARPAK